uniref:Uncharacterized protein n=1 Tax=Poecilia mexicana TaxID=48701 RepID=A0A3B3Y2T1_9TELE
KYGKYGIICIKVCFSCKMGPKTEPWGSPLKSSENLENRWDQSNHLAECCNPRPWNFNGLSAALEEEWQATPQQSITQLVINVRSCCQAVIDALGHMTSD